MINKYNCIRINYFKTYSIKKQIFANLPLKAADENYILDYYPDNQHNHLNKINPFIYILMLPIIRL